MKSSLITEVQNARFRITITTKDRKGMLKELLALAKDVNVNVEKTSAIYNPLSKNAKITFEFNIDDFDRFLKKLKQISKGKFD